MEGAVLGSPSLIVLMVSVDVRNKSFNLNVGVSEFRSCVKVETAVPNSSYGLCGRKKTTTHLT